MKSPALFCLATLVTVLPAAIAADSSAAVAPPAADAPAASSAVKDQLQAIVQRIGDKLRNGSHTEADLKDELKAFDTLLAAHAGDKSEDVASVAFWRAMLYVQVLEQYDRGSELLKQLAADYPGTKAASQAAELVERLDAQKAALQLRASLKPGVAFPDFAEKDLQGKPLSLANYRGKVVLVDFWATWCGPCVAELPNVIAAYDKYHAKGFEIVGISLDQSEEKLKSFLAEHKMTWAQYFDGKGWESKLGRKYGVNSIPATYLLDGEGRIIAKDLRGPALERELEQRLK